MTALHIALSYIEVIPAGPNICRAFGGTTHGGANGMAAGMSGNFAKTRPKVRQTLQSTILRPYTVIGAAPARSSAGSASPQ